MNLKRASLALLLSVFLLFLCNDQASAKPHQVGTSLAEFRLSEHVPTRIDQDPQFDHAHRLVVEQQVAAEFAAEQAAAAAEAARQAELNQVPLYGHGPIWTFDDCEYGSYGNVATIVAILKAYHIERGRGIFFMNGDCYRSRPDLVATLHASGYPIGNHGNIHVVMLGMGQGQIDSMIDGGPHEAMLFRPPGGGHSPLIDNEIASRGFVELLWTLDSGDTAKDPARRTCQPVLNWLRTQVRPDSVVLMHMFNRESARALGFYLSGSRVCS